MCKLYRLRYGSTQRKEQTLRNWAVVATAVVVTMLFGCSDNSLTKSPTVRVSNFTCEKNRTNYDYVANSVTYSCQGVLSTDDEQLKKGKVVVTIARRPTNKHDDSEDKVAYTLLTNGVGKFAISYYMPVTKGEKDPEMPNGDWVAVGYQTLNQFTVTTN